MKKSFVLYHDQFEAVEDLTLEQKGQLFDAIFRYNRGEDLPELDPMIKMAFKFFKVAFDRDHAKWSKIAERNKANGNKGGRPKGKKNKDLSENPDEPRKPTGLFGNPENPENPDEPVNGSGIGNVIASGNTTKEKNITDPPESVTEKFYLTRKKKKLTGKRLLTFESFWKTFDYKKGKADAADAWLDIPQLTDSLVSDICKAAESTAGGRAALVASGGTPIFPQGWLNARRWEDEVSNMDKPPVKSNSDSIADILAGQKCLND